MATDVMTPGQRKKAMRSNRGRTGPERKLASALWRKGHRYMTSDGYRQRFGRSLLGNPDMIFTGKRVVVFVDGCFWHGCARCHNFEKDCNDWWQGKIESNKVRDRRQRRKLRRLGWHVWRVWEHDLRRARRFEKIVVRLDRMLSNLRSQTN